MNHPLQSFTYCPSCGSNQFVAHNEKAKRCLQCGFVFYFNISASVAVFIVNEQDELLVCKRAKEPVKGTLDLPGGFIDMQETAEEGVKREIMEELNLSIDEINYRFSIPNIYPYAGFNVHTLDLFFECKVQSFNNLKASDDVSEAFFISKKKINPADFGLDSIRKGIEIYLN